MRLKKYDTYIGIDVGVNTGFSAWDAVGKKFMSIETLKIHEAMKRVEGLYELDKSFGTSTFVIVEDARKRGGKANAAIAQGVGSVKRDSSIWESFLTDLGIDFEMVAPKKGMTKLDDKKFKMITKWEGRTSEHSRDSGMLIFGK